jgi:ABC-type cobalt transport system substrate-binding protein
MSPRLAADPSGTVEFYAIIFISIGASLGATVFGYIMGKVRKPPRFVLRT